MLSGELLRKKRREKDGHKDPLLQEISLLQEDIMLQISNLRREHEGAEKKRSEIDKVALILGLGPSDRPRPATQADHAANRPGKSRLCAQHSREGQQDDGGGGGVSPKVQTDPQKMFALGTVSADLNFMEHLKNNRPCVQSGGHQVQKKVQQIHGLTPILFFFFPPLSRTSRKRAGRHSLPRLPSRSPLNTMTLETIGAKAVTSPRAPCLIFLITCTAKSTERFVIFFFFLFVFLSFRTRPDVRRAFILSDLRVSSVGSDFQGVRPLDVVVLAGGDSTLHLGLPSTSRQSTCSFWPVRRCLLMMSPGPFQTLDPYERPWAASPTQVGNKAQTEDKQTKPAKGTGSLSYGLPRTRVLPLTFNGLNSEEMDTWLAGERSGSQRMPYACRQGAAFFGVSLV